MLKTHTIRYTHYCTLRHITLHYITLHYITLHYITLHYIHYIHYVTLHHTTLHYTTLRTTSIIVIHCTYILIIYHIFKTRVYDYVISLCTLTLPTEWSMQLELRVEPVEMVCDAPEVCEVCALLSSLGSCRPS